MKIKRVYVNSNLLLRIFRGVMIKPEMTYKVEGIPEDAIVRSVAMDRPDVITYVIESEEFPEVAEGECIPVQDVIVTDTVRT